MPKSWNTKFCERVRALRERRGWTQLQMAEALGIPMENYRKYEKRSPLPQWLLTRFSLIMDITEGDLLAVDRPLPRVHIPKNTG